jgi:hypothetical protein
LSFRQRQGTYFSLSAYRSNSYGDHVAMKRLIPKSKIRYPTGRVGQSIVGAKCERPSAAISETEPHRVGSQRKLRRRPESEKPMEQFLMRIGANWCAARDGEWFDSMNPFTGPNWARIPRGNAVDADEAVRAADLAFRQGPWATMSASARGLLLHRLGDVIAANAEYLADIEVNDNGNLKAEMLGQMKYLPQWFYYYGGLADKVEGRVTPMDKPGIFHYTVHEPVGVVAAIQYPHGRNPRPPTKSSSAPLSAYLSESRGTSLFIAHSCRRR